MFSTKASTYALCLFLLRCSLIPTILQVQHSDVENEGTSKTAPKLMQDFLRHGEECSEIDKEALAIAALDPELELDDTQRDTSYDSLLQRIGACLLCI